MKYISLLHKLSNLSLDDIGCEAVVTSIDESTDKVTITFGNLESGKSIVIDAIDDRPANDDRIPEWPMTHDEFKDLHYNGDAYQIVYGYWDYCDWYEGNTSYMYDSLSDVMDAIRNTDPLDVVRDKGHVPYNGAHVAIRVYFDHYEDGDPSCGPDGYVNWRGNEWDMSQIEGLGL